MSILSIFKSEKANCTAMQAKERLQIVISHQRLNSALSHLLPKLQNDIIKVIEKYIEGIHKEQIDIKLQQQERRSILELNVTIPSR